ncbi:MAG: ABC transporter ATP-binding protein [Pirellula sp.]|jgi:lipopolysaccharide transport system ATP-binding protein
MTTVIKVENISKQYRLGQVGTGSLSEDLTRLWYRIRGKEDPFLKIGQSNDRTKKAAPSGSEPKSGLLSRISPLAARDSSDLVWALKDINFEVKEGEVLGIIGRNGAGKSTLLKILARVTTPTTGSVKVKGRIASLLEVGTGFHPDLTGRENIYLNGAILGMRKHEITHQLDEIIDFSGCDRYIDTPVKRYSSGMYVRLAFAVAAHLEPEILIVDEVLAVGDAEFQKKCLGKMRDVAKGGRTVLFVSHNIGAIKSLCSKGAFLMHGNLRTFGPIVDVLNDYQNSQASPGSVFIRDPMNSDHPSISRVSVCEADSNNSSVALQIDLISDAECDIAIELQISDPTFSVVAYADAGCLVPAKKIRLRAGSQTYLVNLCTKFLAKGSYYVSIDLTDPHVRYYDRAEHCVQFERNTIGLPPGTTLLDQNWGIGSINLPVTVASLNGSR